MKLINLSQGGVGSVFPATDTLPGRSAGRTSGVGVSTGGATSTPPPLPKEGKEKNMSLKFDSCQILTKFNEKVYVKNAVVFTANIRLVSSTLQ